MKDVGEAGDDEGETEGGEGVTEVEALEVDAQPVSDAEADAIPEAELLSEFDKLERSSES